MTQTLRQFLCREDLWERVEALAKLRQVTPDEVIQGALVQLFSKKAVSTGTAASSPTLVPGQPPPPRPFEQPPLYMFMDDEVVVIRSPDFVIGRGAKYCDYALKDPNVSRRHCAIGFQHGHYFIRDLGSTNGIEFDGERIEQQQISEGQVYRICGHELRFSFTAPTAPTAAENRPPPIKR